MSLSDKLANLHILLRAKSFQRWPLEVAFFAEDVYKAWHRVTKSFTDPLRDGIIVALNESIRASKDITGESDIQNADTALRPVGIATLDTTYRPLKRIIETSTALLERADNTCSICKLDLKQERDLVLACPSDGCNCTSHVSCLSQHFLEAEVGANSIIPTVGTCPNCETHLVWTDLVRDLSLRIRGEKERAVLFKEKRRKKNVGNVASSTLATHEELLEDSEGSDQELDEDLDESGFREASSQDGWRLIDDVETSQVFDDPSPQIPSRVIDTSERIVQDSDWDSAEVLE